MDRIQYHDLFEGFPSPIRWRTEVTDNERVGVPFELR